MWTKNNAVSAARGFIDSDKYWLLLVAVLFLIMAVGAPAQAQVLPQTAVPINGEIQSITLTNPADVYSGGRIEVAGYSVILPKNLLIDLPANRLSLQQIFKQAPLGCIAAGQSGLAKTDTCNSTGTGGFATITAVRTAAGDVIAGDVFIQKGVELVSGTVTYISYTDGYFRMNGIAGDPATGVMVRLNDPISRHTVQSGAGCAGGPNCSPDPRFTLDPDNYTNTFSTGYPICIPSTVPRSFPGLPALTGAAIPAIPAQTTQSDASGNGDLLCPSTNRTAAAYETAADSRRYAPIKIGDPVTAEGNFEIIGGVRFLSTHTISVKKSMWTRNLAGQPDYVFLEEVFIEAPAFQNQRMRAMWIGFTTMEPAAPRPTDVDIWSIHRDPLNNEAHEFPLASVRGCDAAAGVGTCSSMGLIGAGANIFRIRYDVDYIQAALGNPPGGADAKLSPCAHLIANPRWTALNLCSGGDTLANNFGILQPEPHEIIARTGHKLDNPDGSLIALDINGLDAQNGEYLFPLGMNLGGIETAEMNEIDLNQMASPVVFEGIPWNLDRRLGPSGCLDNLGNQVACPAGAMGTFALDPFPYSGLDPRTQADFTPNVPGIGAVPNVGTPKGAYSVPAYTNTTLSDASDRVRSYLAQITPGVFKFDGNNTILPFPTASPASQGVITPIVTVPVQCVAGGFAPVAQNDTAVTNAGVAVTIPVLFNDITPVGVMNFASVTIVSAPSGTAIANLDGTVTFTPAGAGTATFTYTVAELTFGGISNVATVTVTVIGAPVAVGDSAVTNKEVPVLIPVLANDSSPSGSLVPATVIATQGANGTTAVNPANGSITYTPTGTFVGNDTFTYTVKDNGSPQQTSNSATVSVTVNNVATPPLALNDAVATGPSTTVTISILANDQAFGAGNALNQASVAIVSAPSATVGALVSGGTGTVDFVPATGFFGTASFTYTVNDTVPLTSNIATVTIIVSSPPTAVTDAATTLEDTAVTINLTANDTDPDGNMLASTVAITTQPGSGTIANLGNGSVTYTPALNANGVITFAYTVSDALGGVSLPATVTVTVTAVNDAPTAGALNLTIAEDNALPVILAGADPDTGDILTYTVTSSLLNGTLTGTAPNMTYTPNLNYSGPAFFTYTVSDGTLTSAPATVAITVTAVNDPPITVSDAAGTTINTARAISVLANDTDVDGTIAPSTVAVTQPVNGTVTVNAVTGVVTYSPNLSFTGVNTFTYTVADNLGAVSAPATVTVNVAGATGTVAVAQAQFKTVTPNVSGDWRVEGTGTAGAVVTIYTGSTIGGPVVGTTTIAADGRWKFQAAGSTVLPGAISTISVQTNGGASRLAFPVAVR